MKLEWLSQPLWVINESELFTSSRLTWFVFWKHFDALFVSFFLSVLLTALGLVFVAWSFRGTELYSKFWLFLAGAVFLTSILLFRFISSPYWNDPIRVLNSDQGQLKVCKVLSAEYVHGIEFNAEGLLLTHVRIEVETDFKRSTHSLSRFFRGGFMGRSYPMTGWIWIDSRTQTEMLLAVRE